MYLKFDKESITGSQLKAIAAILELDEKDIEWSYNVHYEACKYEVECVIENAMDYESAKKFKIDNEDTVTRWADDLYYTSDHLWDELYERAENIVDLELDDIDIEEI